MFIDPKTLAEDPERLEEIEKASMRLVTQSLYEFRNDAATIYSREKDLQADIGEDITREALERVGVSRIDRRLFGKIDYKRARFVFHPDYAVKQALFVDSKAEKGTLTVARIQTAQTSMRIRFRARNGPSVDEAGTLPTVYEEFLTTTIFVKYHYADTEKTAEGRESAVTAVKPESRELRERIGTELVRITVAAIPNGMLQSRYNPDPTDGIWNAGPHSSKRKEKFRSRLSFRKLARKTAWRVQVIPFGRAPFQWEDGG